MHFAIVGAGLSGAVLARELAEGGNKITLFEQRDHVAGNCFTSRDSETGILVHRYGPHIFHTDNQRVWDYVNQYGSWQPYEHRVKATLDNRVFSLPINLHTINQFFGTASNPAQAKQMIAQQIDKVYKDENFETRALSQVGKALYEAFFKGYTQKQWGREPSTLPSSVFARLPLRYNYDDRYFNHRYQAMPEEGYTPFVEALLAHPLIDMQLGSGFSANQAELFDHTFYSGPLDAWFDYRLGRLAYRTLRFEEQRHIGDYQGCAVMNYPDVSVPYTRITEHKHFAPWEAHDQTIIFKEYSQECTERDEPFYPIRLASDQQSLVAYQALADSLPNVTFMGRLGTYRYLDMDTTIAEALALSDKVKQALSVKGLIKTTFENKT